MTLYSQNFSASTISLSFDLLGLTSSLYGKVNGCPFKIPDSGYYQLPVI